MKQVDVIIPVYRPTQKLFTLLDALMEQTVPINQVFLINTEQKYFDGLIAGSNFWQKYKKYGKKQNVFTHFYVIVE